MTTTDLPVTESSDTLDVSDLDRHMGVPMEPGLLKEPVADQRHPALGAGHALPEPAALRRALGRREPLRRARGARSRSPSPSTPATGARRRRSVGSPTRHLIFGGDDWWFFGPRIRPGDHARLPPHALRLQGHRDQLRRADLLPARRHALHQPARRAGRAAAVHGDPLPAAPGQGEEAVLRARPSPSGPTTQLARARGAQAGLHRPDPAASATTRGRWTACRSATELAEHVLGPHSLASFATEWRAYPDDHVGRDAQGPDRRCRPRSSGYTKEMAGLEGDRRMERINPELTDGAYYGPSRGHLQPRWAAARRHAPRLRLRRVDGRVDDRLRGRLGRGVGHGHALERPVPQPGVHRRRHLPRRARSPTRGRTDVGATWSTSPCACATRTTRCSPRATVEVLLPSRAAARRRHGARRPGSRGRAMSDLRIFSTSPLRGDGLARLRGARRGRGRPVDRPRSRCASTTASSSPSGCAPRARTC